MRFKTFVLFVSLITVFSSAFAQTTTPEPKKRPDIPGTFVVEVGVNRAPGRPIGMNLGLWGSRALNIYYQYDLRIMKSRFSFVPGIGLSLERFKFVNGRTLAFQNDSLKLLAGPELDPALPRLSKSQLIMNYIDIPVEIKYSSKPEDPARTFKVSVGGRIGYMFDRFTKYKFRDDGDLFKEKNKQDFNLNRIRYGMFAKVGFGNFSVFGYYNTTNLFKSGSGIQESKGSTLRNVNFNTFTVGISLSSF